MRGLKIHSNLFAWQADSILFLLPASIPNGQLSYSYFEKGCWKKCARDNPDHPQYLSGLSRALFPTTFLEIAVYMSLTL